MPANLCRIAAFAVATHVTMLGLARAELPTEVVAFIEAVKPSPGELRWQKIPWLTDLAAGQRAAADERRPIFLWVTGNDPLGRC